MRKRGAVAAAVLVAALALGGCAIRTPAIEKSEDAMTEDAVTEEEWTDEGLPAAHPSFAAHFTDPVYEDQGSEFAPFGTDEGWDMLNEWAERRDELSPATTVADIIEESGFAEVVAALEVEEGPGIPQPGGQVDAATITIGAGFTLLRLTGRIDEQGRQRTLTALDILIARFASPPELLRQREDLMSWEGDPAPIV